MKKMKKMKKSRKENNTFPSMGFPKASTTLPRRAGPVGTSTIAPVLLTTSPSLIKVSEPKMTIPTLSASKFKAIP